MANNRLYLVAVDDEGNIKGEFFLCKHFGGAWGLRIYAENLQDWYIDINDFLEDAFINGWGITLKAEDMETPLPAIYPYNDDIEKGKWVFIKDEG